MLGMIRLKQFNYEGGLDNFNFLINRDINLTICVVFLK